MAPSNGLKQTDITSFLKPSAKKTSDVFTPIRLEGSQDCSDGHDDSIRTGAAAAWLSGMDSVHAREIPVTYQRRTSKSSKKSDDKIGVAEKFNIKESIIVTNASTVKNVQQESVESGLTVVQSKPVLKSSVKQAHPEKIPGQKRVFGQYFLELGQSDFHLSTCAVCGLRYSRGDDEDEKIHKSFHRGHLQGIQFKGWQDERIVSIFEESNDRIILVQNSDPHHHQHKVKEIMTMMEREMGLASEWLLHRFCKVYLFISSKKVVGCLVSEPIKYAYRVIPEVCISKQKKQHQTEAYSSPREILDKLEEESIWITSPANRYSEGSHATEEKNTEVENHTRTSKQKCKVMQFGNIKFEREVVQKTHLTRGIKSNKKDPGGVIVCSELPVPAVCGVRGIWVLCSERRKGIATKLLNAMRKTFCMGYILEPYQCAFSQPTSDGKAFAIRLDSQ